MTDRNWRQWVMQAVRKHYEGNSAELGLIAHFLVEHDKALALLRSKGYGGDGLSLLHTVEEVPPRAVRDRE